MANTQKKPFFLIFTWVCAVFVLLSGGAAASAQDAHADSSRIVSVGGSITEIIFALGEQDRLVARDTTSSYPAEALDLPDVGYMRRLSAEGILSVDPDLIIAEDGSGPPKTIELLNAAQIGFVIIPDEHSRAGIVGKIKAVAAALGVPEKGAQLAARIDGELKEAEAILVPQARKKRVMFVLSARGNRFMVSGTNTAADSIIRMAGGINAMSEFEGFKPITDEAMSGAMPDVILLMQREGPFQITDQELMLHPAVSITPAAKTGNFVRMDGLFLLGFGPRTAQAILELNRKLYRDAG